MTTPTSRRDPGPVRSLAAGSGASKLGLRVVVERCPGSRMQVPAARDVRWRADPVVLRVITASVTEPVEAVDPSGGHQGDGGTEPDEEKSCLTR